MNFYLYNIINKYHIDLFNYIKDIYNFNCNIINKEDDIIFLYNKKKLDYIICNFDKEFIDKYNKMKIPMIIIYNNSKEIEYINSYLSKINISLEYDFLIEDFEIELKNIKQKNNYANI